MTSDQKRLRAETSFRSKDQVRNERKSLVEYEIRAVATREKTARLKALRLARDAASQKFSKAK